MPDQDGRSNVAELWRDWLKESERQWNSFFNDVMGGEAFGRFMGGYLEAYSALQRTLNQGMERYLNTFNLPTHSDVVELGDRLRAIEERIAALETGLNNLAAAVGAPAGARVTQIRPRRTRRPRTQAGDNA